MKDPKDQAMREPNTRILALYGAMAPYMWDSLHDFAETYSTTVDVVTREATANAPFQFASSERVKILNYDELHPNLPEAEIAKKYAGILINGWKKPSYLDFAKKQSIPRICFIDNPYRGNTRQILGGIWMRKRLRESFTHAWVAGRSQYRLASWLGFKDENIQLGAYSAKTPQPCDRNTNNGIRTILFVGRLLDWKGVEDLCQAFTQSLKKTDQQWQLVIAGKGPLQQRLQTYANRFSQIRLAGFVAPKDLPRLFASADVFCMPSWDEHWGVALHEAAFHQLPLIASSGVQSATEFLIPRYNGWSFDKRSVEGLSQAIDEAMNNTDQLPIFGRRSRQLAKRHTQDIWSAKLHGMLNRSLISASSDRKKIDENE